MEEVHVVLKFQIQIAAKCWAHQGNKRTIMPNHAGLWRKCDLEELQMVRWWLSSIMCPKMSSGVYLNLLNDQVFAAHSQVLCFFHRRQGSKQLQMQPYWHLEELSIN